ncbi:M15 family metallopeptidase [Streptomyces acidicola]|uniref:M15 family metallopeptidase n=1 Tax=Streptomyces acidicola TaxID=2596892 RepID=UPI00379F7C41
MTHPNRRLSVNRRMLVNRRLLVPALMASFLATACTTSADSGSSAASTSQQASASPTPSPTPSANAAVRAVPAAQWQRIQDAGMVGKGCPITSPDQLRRVEINHHGFDGKIRRGVLVVNADTADSVARVFTRLFDAEFPIRRMKPLEEYGGDNTASLAADNTAAFNCRRPDQINAPALESPHANGRAVDINPLENPWKDLRCKCWKPRAEYNARTEGKGKILEGGTVWRVFVDEGWIWQDIDVPDYMHFDTGYPSKPYAGPDASASPGGDAGAP